MQAPQGSNQSMTRYTRYILAIITTIACTAMAGAEPSVNGYPLPANHFKSVVDTSEALVRHAYESARENSPFATFEGETTASDDSTELIDKMKDFAATFLGTRYRLGAAGPKQFDCSGFVGYVFRNFGFNLHRDSRSQYLQGERVEKDELKPGDLLFFSSRSSGKGRVGHVHGGRCQRRRLVPLHPRFFLQERGSIPEFPRQRLLLTPLHRSQTYHRFHLISPTTDINKNIERVL